MSISAIDLGRISFQESFQRQIQAQDRVRLGIWPNTIFLCEHPQTITFTRQSRVDNILDKNIVRDSTVDFIVGVNRGGDITYHGPGQLIGYFIFDLRELGRDLGLFLSNIEEVIIRALFKFGIGAQRRQGLRGVWVGEEKIASLGIGVDRWISQHGFALNVNTDLAFFDKIRPCGLDVKMSSLQSCLGRLVDLDSVKRTIIAEVFNVFQFIEHKGTGYFLVKK